MAIDDTETKMVELESAARYMFTKCDSRNRQYITKVDIMNAMHLEESWSLFTIMNLCNVYYTQSFSRNFDSRDSNGDGKIDYFELLNFVVFLLLHKL